MPRFSSGVPTQRQGQGVHEPSLAPLVLQPSKQVLQRSVCQAMEVEGERGHFAAKMDGAGWC